MGLSNARRALVVDSNPWNRRQICDVLAQKGYEVSACDSLGEARDFYRSHPIVVASSGGAEEELAAFVEFVRGSAGTDGGYVIQLAGEDEAAGESSISGLDIDDVIDPCLDAAGLEAKLEKADEWLQRHTDTPTGPAEVISSGPGSPGYDFQPRATGRPVKAGSVIEAPSDTGEGGRDSSLAEAVGVAPPSPVQGDTSVSIRRGKALGRPAAATAKGGEKKLKGRPMPAKNTTKYQYNLLIENAPLAMAMFDKDMRYLIANELWRRQFDLESVDVIGRGHFDIFSEVSERWQKLLDRARDEDREVAGEEYVEWPDGNTDWVRWTMRPWEGKDGKPGGLVISCAVISEERARRASAGGADTSFEYGLAESLMKSGVTPLVVLDFDGRVQRCNRIAKRWGDWGGAGGDDRYFWDAFVPEGQRQAVRESFHGHAAAMQDDGQFIFPPVSVEAVCDGQGGEQLVAWTNTPRVGEGGVITGLVRVGVEIKDEQLPVVEVPVAVEGELDEESIAELRDEWMDSFPLMCWRTNSRGKIKFFNRQWLDFRGRNALEECDNGWMDGLHEEDYDSLIHAFDTAAKTGARVNHVARILGGDGQYRWLRFVSARDFSDLEGASDGLVGYCEDLGRVIRLENELSAARSRYDELLEDSTGAFRAKRDLEAQIASLGEQLEGERARLAEERDAAVAAAREELDGAVAQVCGELDGVRAELERARAELDSERARLESEHSEELAALGEQKDAQLARAVEDKEAELGRILEEKQAALAESESALAAKLGRAEAELDKLRAERDDQVAEHAQGIASLKADFESAAEEKERLAAEVGAEKERQKERDAELQRLRKEASAAHKLATSATTERDQFITIPQNAPFGMVLIARDGEVLYSNAATSEITGVDFGDYATVEDWLLAQAPGEDDGGKDKLLELWRGGIWRQDATKVLSMQTDRGLRELELKSKLLPDGQLLLTMSDVTDSLRAEEALRASEVKFRSIFYDSGVGMALVDKTGSIFDANPAQEKLTGYTRAELRKMHIEDCLSLEEIARTQELAKEMGATRSRSGEMTVKLQPKDGRPAWAHMNISLVRDPDGEVIFAAYFFHDVTKEREAIAGEQQAISNVQQATASLESTQAEKRAIAEASPDLIVVVGPDGKVASVVPPVSFPLHVDHAMEGRPVGEVIPPVAEELPKLAAAARLSGGVETGEFSVPQEDETLHFEYRVAASGVENTVIVVRDITAAKKAEEAMRRQALTFASIRDAIIVADLKGRISDWNPAAEQMFGYSREEALGKGLYALYDPEEPKRFKQTITAAISKQRRWEARTPFHRKDGTVGECEVRYTPLLDEQRRPVALVGVSRLATEAPAAPAPAPMQAAPMTGVDPRAAERRLRESLESLAHVVAAQESAAGPGGDPRSELAVNRARLEAVSLLHKVMEEGGDFETVQFGKYVSQLVRYLLAEFGPSDAGIEVHLNVKGVAVPAAAAQPLAIILFELLSNSLRHAFERRTSGMVGVSMGIGENSGWMVVNDDGVGLPAGFNLGAPPHGAGLKIAADQAKQIHGELKLADAEDTEIQVLFEL